MYCRFPVINKITYRKQWCIESTVIPVRGIARFENNRYIYIFKHTGTIERFDGIEQIYKDNKLIYELHCSGGIIE